jgi:glycosyltransferase involved in cell wall biosynthesis
MRVAALIPAYCEERFIADVARRTSAQLADVLVVDDGSPDRTAELARSAGIEVIRHEVNQGKGAAIQTGLRTLHERGFDYVVLLDGDGQHRPEEIRRFVETADREHTRLLVGNRMGDTHDMPLPRRLTNQFMSGQISWLCGQRIPDTQCGFRMIHRDLVPLLLGRGGRFDYETEMLILAAWQGFRISAVAVSTVYGEETSSIHPVRDTLRFVGLMARYWWKRLLGGRRKS